MKSQYYKITPIAARRFRCWTINRGITVTAFAKKCGCSRQYIHRVIKGVIHVTPSVIALFKKGGYDLL